MIFSVTCSNCKTPSPDLPPRSQVVVCQQCGHGCRLRFRDAGPGLGAGSYMIQLAPLEPPHDDPKQQAASSGALMAGWR